ncbi:MAG: methyltransferase domain-containing protein [Elusimicrobiota bacterium]
MKTGRITRACTEAAFCLFLGTGDGYGQSLDRGEILAQTAVNAPFWPLEMLVRTQRTKIPYIDKLLDILEIRPGMTILDIGAGTGQQAVMLAERMKGTGVVFATEIQPNLVDYITAQARQRKLANLKAILVKAGGIDPFYGEHRYDLILFYSVVNQLRDRINYYRQLKSFLAPHGRVVVVDGQPGNQFSFFREDFEDWDGLVKELKREPPDSPFSQTLHDPELVAEIGIERAVLFQLNSLIQDGLLFTRFSVGLDFVKGVSFTPEETPMALWLLHHMRMAQLPEKRLLLDLSMREFSHAQKLNKLLIVQRLRPYLRQPTPYHSSAPESRWFLNQALLPREHEFTAAGYRLENLLDLPPFQKIWIFSTTH